MFGNTFAFQLMPITDAAIQVRGVLSVHGW